MPLGLCEDPDGMIVEYTLDADDVADINAMRLADARSELKRWLAGDHRPNNRLLRAEEHAH